MNPKYLLVNPLGSPIAAFNRLDTAFKAAQRIDPTHNKFGNVVDEMDEDGDVLLDNGLSIYQNKQSS